jgi:hypothetical protein
MSNLPKEKNMSQQGVKKVVGSLISDPSFAAAFHANPQKTVHDHGLDVDANEIAALSKLKASDLQVAVHQRPGGTVASYEIDVRSAKV